LRDGRFSGDHEWVEYEQLRMLVTENSWLFFLCANRLQAIELEGGASLSDEISTRYLLFRWAAIMVSSFVRTIIRFKVW
jgi:hypothetical protein